MIIAGHGRVLAAEKLGLAYVPVIVLSHLSKSQRRALVIADNRIAENAGWDDAMLKAEIAALREDAFDLDPVELKRGARTYETVPMGGLIGALRDAGPDYWGRRVIVRHRGVTELGELDYLLHPLNDRAGARLSNFSAPPPPRLRHPKPTTIKLADSCCERGTTGADQSFTCEAVEKMADQRPHFSAQERDFDLLLMEEVAFDARFFSRLLVRIGLEQMPPESIRHAVYENFGGDAWGETDVLLQLSQGPTLLLENKLSAPFQDGQAQRYRARALHHVSDGMPALTVLIAPLTYLAGVERGEWDHIISYQELAEMITVDGPRSSWRRALLNDAGNRSARVSRLAANPRAATAELAAFKAAWQKAISRGSEWQANPQIGATDEFLYRPRHNPKGLTIWQHPMAGYLSVQVKPEHARQVKENLPSPLPEGMRLTDHPSTVYLDAATSTIDMSSSFDDERPKVETSMTIARQALDLVETAVQ